LTFRFLAGISSLVLLYPLVAGISRFKRVSRPVKIICIHIFIAAVFEIISRWYWLHRQNNLFLLHLYTFWELEIISLFYLQLLRQRMMQWGIAAGMIVFALFSWADAFYMDGLKHFNTYARPVACIMMMVYAIVYLYKRLSDAQPISFTKEAVLILNAAFLFYFSVSFFLFLLSNYMLQDAAKTHTVWAMHTLVAAIFYTTIGRAIWMAPRQ